MSYVYLSFFFLQGLYAQFEVLLTFDTIKGSYEEKVADLE